ncbi:MAG: ATP-grasp domain-containing protein [Myxococcales bacterium]
MGLRVVGLDRNLNAPALLHADQAHQVDTHDVQGIIETARRERAAGIVTLCTDLPVRGVAAASRELGLCAVSVEAAEAATHKGKMREAFACGGAPIPRFSRVRSLAEARDAADRIGLPVILKPPASSGSRGIFKVARNDQVAAGYKHASSIAGSDEILVEEFVEGPEVSVETLSFRGEHRIITITDKRTTGDPFWVESGHVEPSRLSQGDQDAIRQATLAGLNALGIDNSAGHVEIRVGRDGPRIMEIGSRLGGDFITTELVPRSTGVDMVEAIIRIALGEQPDWQPKFGRGAAIRYVLGKPGIVRSVEGEEAARGTPGVVRLEIDVKPGDHVSAVTSSLERPGFVIAEGASAAEAEGRAAAAADRIVIGVEESNRPFPGV